MMKNEAPLSVRGLCKSYPGFRLEDVSFDLDRGAITGFIGRNGAGKTATLNSILSFVRPDGGQVLFSGLDMERHADEIKEKIGFVSAGMSYYVLKKLKAITKTCASFYPQWDAETYQRYMRRFGLDENKTPAELLILDEPTSGLDPVSREELIEIFLSLRDAGKTILFSTHITADLEKCADRVIFLRQGHVVADKPYRDFAASYRLISCEGALPPALEEKALGVCRTRDGCTVLVKQEDAGDRGRLPDLDEIMIHLDKEDAQ